MKTDFDKNPLPDVKKDTAVLVCESMRPHLDAAQKAAGTDYPAIPLEWELHREPSYLRARLIGIMEALPGSVTTLLSAVGLCGGWDGIRTPCRLVLPDFDDCVSLLLCRDAADTALPQDRIRRGNLKRPEIFYFHDSDTGEHSPAGYLRDLQTKYGTEQGLAIFGSMTQNYTGAAIIDTGAYDCCDVSFVEEVQENADLLRCPLDYVQGSNLVLEKLLAGARDGAWDGPFLVYEAGETVREADFAACSADGTAGQRRPY